MPPIKLLFAEFKYWYHYYLSIVLWILYSFSLFHTRLNEIIVPVSPAILIYCLCFVSSYTHHI